MGTAKKMLILAAASEIAGGVAFLLLPALAGRLLLGEEMAGAANVFARAFGIALIGLGIACWPGPPIAGMLAYSVVVTLFLAFVGLAGGMSGVLLWPAVVLHAVLTVLLAWEFARGRAAKSGG